jgi:hypothetical protein
VAGYQELKNKMLNTKMLQTSSVIDFKGVIKMFPEIVFKTSALEELVEIMKK